MERLPLPFAPFAAVPVVAFDGCLSEDEYRTSRASRVSDASLPADRDISKRKSENERMDVAEALRVLGLPGDDVDEKQSVRRAYLRRALEVHPDVSSRRGSGLGPSADSGSTTNRSSDTASFQRLREAYEVALGHVAGRDKNGGFDSEEEDDLLMRAFRGEDVRAALARRGGWRPGEAFGVDLGVRWMGDDRSSASSEGGVGEGWREALEAGLAVDEDMDGDADDG